MTRSVPLSSVVPVLRSQGLLLEFLGREDAVVSGVTHDSRQVSPGDLFLAWSGAQVDAHDFVGQAVERGAAAVVVERPVPGVDVPQLVVSDGRQAAARAAAAFFGEPGRELDAVAVTGTNGKTTTVLLIRHILAALPGGAASVGTLGVTGPDGRVREGTEGLTTPDPVRVSRWLRQLADEGVGVVAMEASSHALDQHRLDGVPVRVAVFTNLSRDHLDYHGTMEAYRVAKRRLADLVRDDGVVVLNAAEPAWAGLSGPRTVTFALGGEGDLRAENVLLRPSGTRFTLHWQDRSAAVDLPLIGAFNVENALAAAAVALVLGVELQEVADRLATAPQVPGRMERVVAEPFTVLIDFAHTPDALDTLLATVREIATGRLSVLFGAGGDRDRGKRRPMAEAVARHADRVYLTSDNPRTEDPERILDDLEPGLGTVARVRQVDRRAAIRQAVEEAASGDVLVLAGKGHERYQVVGRERLPLDERIEVAEAMRLRGAA